MTWRQRSAVPVAVSFIDEGRHRGQGLFTSPFEGKCAFGPWKGGAGRIRLLGYSGMHSDA